MNTTCEPVRLTAVAIANDIVLDTLLLRAWHLQQRNRLLRGIAVAVAFCLATCAATAGFIEMYFKVAR